MRTRIWTRDMCDRLRALAAKGLPAWRIAEEMGKSVSSIQSKVKKLGLRTCGQTYKPLPRLAGNPFYEARMAKGLSRAEAAERIGISTQMIADYETGRRRPGRPDIWGSVAYIYGMELDYLLGTDVLDSIRRT